MVDHHAPDSSYDSIAIQLEYWLATQAQAGVPELVLCWMLSHYASVIDQKGFVTRSWLEHGPSIDTSVGSENDSEPFRREGRG